MNRYIRVLLLVVLLGTAGFAKGHEELTPDNHRSEVSRFVQELTALADKDRNIGLEISEIAKEQSENASKSAEAIEAVKNRNPLVTFLLGTDYKNIGRLRSQLVTNQNHIERLTKAMGRAKNADIKAELQTQIDELQITVAQIEQFIKDNEGKFSILGWVVKFLVQ